MTEPESTLI